MYSVQDIVEALSVCGEQISGAASRFFERGGFERVNEDTLCKLLGAFQFDGGSLRVASDRLYDASELKCIMASIPLRKQAHRLRLCTCRLKPLSDGRFPGLAINCVIWQFFVEILTAWQPTMGSLA